MKNVAVRNVIGRLEALNKFFLYDATQDARVDVETIKGAAARVSTAGGVLMT
jgi:hypothetical protein